MHDPVPRAQPPPAHRPAPLWGLRPNPLRRRCDLVRAWITLALAAAVLGAVPVVSVAVGRAVHGSLTADAEARAASLHRVTAVLERDAPRHPEPGSAEADLARYPAPVRWTGPDGRVHRGETEVPAGVTAGSTVPLWCDAGGRAARAPMSAAEVRNRSIGWGAAAGAAVAVAGAVTYAVVGRVLDRRRLAEWDAAWAAAAPRWSASA
ncbi:Rv1733c family protein [Streptomyces zhihengii]|uniref:Rv1733c family protein n=1 Tax=Streptomyces zhihengii TaxID=1818004 RepID=UPI00364390E7